MFLQTNASLIN